ncbi:MAG: TonB-dependent receptor [Desulfobacterales bacterium]|nr:TonB-dependent receptor [Desulfobacterales bacterium]
MRKGLIYWMVLAITLCLPVVSSAEEDKHEAPVVTTMEEVLVSATKTEEQRKDIPNSVILVDRYDIQESPAKTVGELLGNELGIDWRTYGNYGGASEEIKIRGMSSDGTQVLVNGVSRLSPSLGIANVAEIPLNSIERIEIVKGSGSLLYGSGAMGGTINIITKRPANDKIDAKATAGYGSESTYLLSAEQGMNVIEDLGYYITANKKETDGFRDNGDLTHNDVSLNLVLDKDDVLDISLYGEYVNREFGQPGVQPPEGTQDYYVKNEIFYNSESASLLNRHEDTNKMAVLNVKSNPLDWLGLSLKGDYTSLESYNYMRNAGASWPKVAGEGYETWIINDIAGIEGFFTLTPHSSTEILLGMDYNDYGYENRQGDIDASGNAVAGTIATEEHKVHTNGSFAEAQYRPSRYIKFLAGIRHESHSTFGSEDLPRFGLILNPFEHTALKFSHGKHFKAPTMNDLFWPDDGWTRGNPDLKAETGWHSDVTLEQSLLSDKLFFEATYFDWDIKDKINWAENPAFPTPVPGFNYWTPSNVDTYEAQGCEIGARIKPIHNTILSLSYTYTDATEELSGGTVRQAQYTARHLFKGDISYWFDFGLTATFIGRYVGSRPAFYNTAQDEFASYILDSYWTADLKLEQRLYDKWLIGLQGTNLFDTGYYTRLSNFQDQTSGLITREGFPGAERAVFCSLTYEY